MKKQQYRTESEGLKLLISNVKVRQFCAKNTSVVLTALRKSNIYAATNRDLPG